MNDYEYQGKEFKIINGRLRLCKEFITLVS